MAAEDRLDRPSAPAPGGRIFKFEFDPHHPAPPATGPIEAIFARQRLQQPPRRPLRLLGREDRLDRPSAPATWIRIFEFDFHPHHPAPPATRSIEAIFARQHVQQPLQRALRLLGREDRLDRPLEPTWWIRIFEFQNPPHSPTISGQLIDRVDLHPPTIAAVSQEIFATIFGRKLPRSSFSTHIVDLNFRIRNPPSPPNSSGQRVDQGVLLPATSAPVSQEAVSTVFRPRSPRSSFDIRLVDSNF